MIKRVRKYFTSRQGKILAAVCIGIRSVIAIVVALQPEKTKEELRLELNELREAEARGPNSPVAHCFNQYPQGLQRTECVDAYWDSLWMHPNLAEAQTAFMECNEKLNQRYPDSAVHPTRKSITSTILTGGWDADLPTREEANDKVNEDIRGWNEFNPGLNCRLAK